MAQEQSADRRKARVRRTLRARAYGKPRLSVFRSSKQIYAQVIDDEKGVTVASASSLEKDNRGALKTGANIEAAKTIGKLIAERAVAAGRQGSRVRPRRLYVPRPRQGSGRRRARGRPAVLRLTPTLALPTWGREGARIYRRLFGRRQNRSNRPGAGFGQSQRAGVF